MANTLVADSNSTVSGLGTSTFIAPSTIHYSISVESTLTPPTGVQIVINQNGTPLITKAISAPSAMSTSASVIVAATAGDSITVVLTSSVLNDTLLNNVKSTITISTLSY